MRRFRGMESCWIFAKESEEAVGGIGKPKL